MSVREARQIRRLRERIVVLGRRISPSVTPSVCGAILLAAKIGKTCGLVVSGESAFRFVRDVHSTLAERVHPNADPNPPPVTIDIDGAVCSALTFAVECMRYPLKPRGIAKTLVQFAADCCLDSSTPLQIAETMRAREAEMMRLPPNLDAMFARVLLLSQVQPIVKG